jgi:hypothetical protein
VHDIAITNIEHPLVVHHRVARHPRQSRKDRTSDRDQRADRQLGAENEVTPGQATRGLLRLLVGFEKLLQRHLTKALVRLLLLGRQKSID